jgi:flagellin
MDIRSLAGIQPPQNTQRTNNAKLAAAIASLVSGSRVNRASDDVAALSVATQLQSVASNLKQVSGNLAEASSLAQVADAGAEKIQEIAERLQTLASQAQSPTLNADNRAALNAQFQQLKAEIDRFADNTSFGGKKLLDGSVGGDNALSLGSLLGEQDAEANRLSIESLYTSNLFSGASLDLRSPEAANQAFAVVGDALNKITDVRATIGSFEKVVDVAAASIDTAVANQEAARAILQDADFAEASTQFSLASLQRNAGLALAAQGNRLSPALLQLVAG